MSNASNDGFSTLVATMHRLRAPGGCPWDAEQTHASLKRYVIEEAHEVCEAIDGGNDDELLEELGDLLLQVAFHAELAAERGAFTLGDVVERLVAKLIRRHPHVFGSAVARSSDEVVANWSRIKAAERVPVDGAPPTSALDGVPKSLPALLRAHRLGEKASLVGFDWRRAVDARSKIDEELGELDQAVASGDDVAIADESGDVLFAVSNYTRLLKINGETALQTALGRFERRFRVMEAATAARGEDLKQASPAELEARWQTAKAEIALSDATSVRAGPRRDP